ncbi:MAG TPA: hypothetical protein VNW46_18125 [Gemmatimonadaceae bacterium]|nr:hypothetical protein [Gemmatimonadaceae bacterium]
MTRRRWFATLATLFLLQLVFVESGYACAMPATGSSAMASMPGMTMPAHESKGPCRFPWAPDGCQSMAPCAPAALAVPGHALAVAPQLVAAVPVLIVRTPPSETAPPELPPPRV